MNKVLPDKILKKWGDLVQTMATHDRLYYEDNAPVISDAAYDHLRAELVALEATYPALLTLGRSSQTIGYPVAQRKVRHLAPVYSLDTLTTWPDFLKKVQNFLGTDGQDLDWVCEPKIDGLTLILRYEKGRLTRGATRGNGHEGEDVTRQLSCLKDLPPTLKGKNWPDVMEVRGEAFMTKQDFLTLNALRQSQALPLFANARNAAAGTLRNMEDTKSRLLHFIVHGFSFTPFSTYKETIDWLGTGGLPIQPLSCLRRKIKELETYFQDLASQRDRLAYDMDGVVFKLNHLDLQERLGHCARTPRYAIAQKFPAHECCRLLKAVEFQVGRTGVVTPVAILEPAFLGGVWISRASLHNACDMERKDIRIGDHVILQRAGDVIPYVAGVDLSQRPEGTQKIVFPLTCPSCGHELDTTEKVFIRCPQGLECPEQKLWSLRHFISQPAFNFVGLGNRRLEQLVHNGLIKDPCDFFSLEAHKLLSLEGWGPRLVHTLLATINQRRQISLERFIYALGIEHVGKANAHMLAQFTDLQGFFKLLAGESMEKIQGVGPVLHQALVAYGKAHWDSVLTLASLLTIHREMSASGPLSGKTVVFTGTLHTMTRSEAKAQAIKAGAKVLSQPSLTTDYLVLGEKAGKKAQAPGVKHRLTEEQWQALIQ